MTADQARREIRAAAAERRTRKADLARSQKRLGKAFARGYEAGLTWVDCAGLSGLCSKTVQDHARPWRRRTRTPAI